MYSGIFYNLFLIWGKYKRSPLKTTLAVLSSSTTRRWTGRTLPAFGDGIQKEIDNRRI